MSNAWLAVNLLFHLKISRKSRDPFSRYNKYYLIYYHFYLITLYHSVIQTVQARNGMLESMLSCCDTQALADFCSKVTGENIAKLFLAEGIADDKTTKDRSQSTLSSR